MPCKESWNSVTRQRRKLDKEGKLMEKQQVKQVKVEVTFTEGYEQRFTEALLRQYDKHVKENERKEKAG